MKATKIFWGLIVLIILSILLGFVSFYILSYDSFIAFAVESLHRPDLELPLRNQFFTLQKFTNIRTFSLFIIPLLIIILFLLLKKRKWLYSKIESQIKLISQYIRSGISEIKNSKKTTRIAFITLLTLITIRSIYYALHFYAQYDECWNYNYFLSNTPLTTLVAWNNYPLHNLLSFILLKILPDTTFVLRIPSILFGLLSSILVFVVIKKGWRNELLALCGLAIFTVLPMNIFYFLFARGVMMAIFFGIILFYFLIIKKLERKDVILISVCAALGTYSMISFPLFVIALVLAALISAIINKENNIPTLIQFSIASAFLALFLLLPFLLGSGISLGTNSQYVSASFSLQKILDSTQLNAHQFIGTYHGTYIFLGLNFILLFLLKKERSLIIANIFILGIEFLLPLLSHVFLPARALGYEVIAYFFTLLLILFFIYKTFNKSVLITLSILTFVGFSYVSHNHIYLNWSYDRDKEVYTIAKLLQENNIKKYHNEDSDFNYYVPGISYYYKLNHKEIDHSTSTEKSTRYQKLIPKNTEALIIPTGVEYNNEAFPNKLYENERFTIKLPN